jgi:nitroreductase
MVLKEIRNRRSVREFKADQIRDDVLLDVIKAGFFAPSARNNKAAEFLVIRDQDLKDKITLIVGQEFIKTAQVLIIPAIDSEKSVLPVQDLSVISENIFLQAVHLGLGSVWKNLNPDWEEKVKEITGIPENYRIINIIPIGYPKEETVSHTDDEFSGQKIHQEKW